MVLSASRRTDIPAYYAGWFLNRLRKGECLYPVRGGRLGRIRLSPEWIDCIVFWTKNPLPILEDLDEISAMGYPFYFEFTVTPYEAPLEHGLPAAAKIDAFHALSRKVGAERVDWRYDPILLGGNYTVAFHLSRFGQLCRALHKDTTRCIISFLDAYPHTGTLSGGSPEEMRAVAKGLSEIAAGYGLPLLTCAESIGLEEYGIWHAACIDREKIGKILGCPIDAKKDPGQRRECGCVESVDIGVYNTCPAGCAYCYATTEPALARRWGAGGHDPMAPMLTGWPAGAEAIYDRTGPSLKKLQTSLFEEF